MAYKNSAGNSGISNEMGSWRYFTSAMERLGTYKGAKINNPIPSANIPEKVNWFKAAAKAVEGGLGVYESYREREYKRAEEYLNTHSLEDYKKAVQSNNVPFQYDYLAMSRLKEGMGENISKIAAQDFQEMVDRNAFRGMSPEQVDAAFYEHMQESINEFNDGTLGFETDDQFFNRGVYKDANKTRVAMLLEHSKAEDNFLQQQFEQQTLTKIKGLAQNPQSTNEEIVAGMQEILQTTYRSSPEAQYKYIQTLLNELGNNARGDEILESIGEVEVEKGVTLRQYLGEAEYQKARINAESFRFKTDANYRANFQLKVDGWVRNGAVNTIRAALQDEIRTSGNVQSAEYEYLLRALGQAQDKQYADYQAAARGSMKANAAAEWIQYYRDLAAGKEVVSYEKKKFEIDGKYGSGSYSSNDLKVYQQGVVDEIIETGDTDRINTLMGVVVKDSISSNEMGKYMTNALKTTFATIDDAVTQVAVNGAKLSEEQLSKVAQSQETLFRLYSNNPAAFTKMMSDGGQVERLQQFRRMDMATRLGRDPIEMEASLQNYDKLIDAQMKENTGNATNLRKLQQIKNYTIPSDELELTSSNITKNMQNNEFLAAEVKIRAMNVVQADPTIKTADALEAAQEQVLSEYSLLGPTAVVVPKSFLREYSNDQFIKTVPDDDYMEAASRAFSKIIMHTDKNQTAIHSEADYNGSYMSTMANGEYAIVVVDSLGRERGTVPFSQLAKETDKLIKDEFNFEKLDREVKARNMGMHHFITNPSYGPILTQPNLIR